MAPKRKHPIAVHLAAKVDGSGIFFKSGSARSWAESIAVLAVDSLGWGAGALRYFPLSRRVAQTLLDQWVSLCLPQYV